MDDSPDNSGSEVIVSLRLKFKPGSIDHVVANFRPAIARTRAEPGNIDFQFFKVADSDDTFIIIERWKDQAALNFHWRQPYTQEILALFDAYLVKPFSETEDVTYLLDMAL